MTDSSQIRDSGIEEKEAPAASTKSADEHSTRLPSEDEPRLQFLYAALADTQGTIRALDQKLYILTLVLAAPFAAASSILAGLVLTYAPGVGTYSVLMKFFVSLAIACWIGAWVSTLKGLMAIKAPRVPDAAEVKVTGAFFRAERSTLKDACDGIASILMTNELVFEQLKVAQIRDSKINWEKRAFRVTAALMVVVGVVVILYVMRHTGRCFV